jgi:molybdenum cofactor cytidylyltransferase
VSDTTRTASLTRALGLEQPSGVVAIVGGGGKSSLMFALAGALPGRTVMTTTTRIFAAQMDLALEVCTLADAGWRERLDAFDKSLGIDQVVVEADGSRMRPVKAPAAHEPVIPDATSLLVVVAGIDALSGPIREVAHRPERVGAITGLDPEQALTPDALVRLLTSPEGGLKGAPPAARVAVLINKVESPEQRDAARRVARGILREPRVERVAIGALQDRATWDWEICRRREP